MASRFEFRSTGKRSRTYQLSESLIAAIDQAAAEWGCWPSEVIETLLTNAFTELEGGRMRIKKIPVRYRIEVVNGGTNEHSEV